MINKRQKPAIHVKRYLDTSRIRQKRKRRRTILTTLAVLVLVGGLWGVIYIFRLPQFQYSVLDISGLKRVVRGDVESVVNGSVSEDSHLFGIIPNTSSFFIDDSSIEKKLIETIPRIKSVKVDSHLNGHIEVKVVERGPFAKWCQSDDIKSANVEIQGTSTDVIASSTPKTIVKNYSSTCYDLDINGYIFGDSKIDAVVTSVSDDTKEQSINEDTSYIFKGLIDGDPIGQTYLNQETLTRIAGFLKFLKDKGKSVSSIVCDSLDHCDVILSSKSKIIINVSEDLKLTIDRFEVALNTEGLKHDNYEYVDLRYGNKIFFKVRSGNSESSTSMQVINEAGDTIRKPVSSNGTTKPTR